MDIRVLKYFLTVAKEENITKAANRLYITQPTLSRQIGRLEAEVGVRLFDRDYHTFKLTAEGAIFYKKAQEIVMISDDIMEELSSDHSAVSGSIAIGCGQLLCTSELGKLIAGFRRLYPGVRFEISSGHASELKQKLEMGLLDLGLLIEPVDIKKYERVHMKTKEEWGVLIPKELPLAKKETIRAADLAGHPLAISKSDVFVRDEVHSWFGELSAALEPAIEYDMIYNAAAVARESGALVVCIRLNCDYAGLVFRPLEPALELS